VALLPESVDYTDKDFDSLRARLINLVRSAFPDWTDFNVSNFGNILLELFAFTGDILLFYQDNQARESRITTAQLRKSLIGLSKLLGFRPAGATASTVDITVSLAAPPIGAVAFTAGDTFRTREITDPIVFQVLTGGTIPAGMSPASIVLTVENSLNSTELFTSPGLANQEYRLSDTPYLDDSAVIVAADGTYTEVENFLSSTSADRHFTTVVDENDRVTIRFGNGLSGAIPQGVITFDYKTGGGSAGNVEPNSIARADVSYADTFGNPQSVTVANALKASGGSPRQSVEGIRAAAPESIRAINRTVAREDFEINAKKVAGVSRALMLTSNERPAIDENAGQLHIIPDGGGLPSTALKAAVEAKVCVELPKTLTFVLSVVDPVYLTIDVQATVFLATGQTASIVDARIRSNLTALFALDLADGGPNLGVDFGANSSGEIAWSDVHNVVRDTVGVRKVGDGLGDFLLNGIRSDVSIEVQEFPQLGTVTILNGDTGAALA